MNMLPNADIRLLILNCYLCIARTVSPTIFQSNSGTGLISNYMSRLWKNFQIGNDCTRYLLSNDDSGFNNSKKHMKLVSTFFISCCEPVIPSGHVHDCAKCGEKNDTIMKISIIIPTKNRKNEVITCIRSILSQTLLPDEIIVVDSSESEDLCRLLREVFPVTPFIRYIHSSPGLTLQKNIGVRAAQGDILFFFDDDIVLDLAFISEVHSVFKNDKTGTVGGVFGNIVESCTNEKSKFWKNVSNSLQSSFLHSIATVFLLSKVRKNGKFQLSGFSTHPYGYDSVEQVECVPGGLTAYRKEVFYNFKFDEFFQGYCYMEDVDFSFRESKKFRNVYTPHAKVVHNESPLSRDRRYENRKMLIMNHYYLFMKNQSQDFLHVTAFWWSVLGLFFIEMIKFNYCGLRGLWDGFISRGDFRSTKDSVDTITK